MQEVNTPPEIEGYISELRAAVVVAEGLRVQKETLPEIEAVFDEQLQALEFLGINLQRLAEFLLQDQVPEYIQTLAVGILGIARILHVAANQVQPPAEASIAKVKAVYDAIPLEKVSSKTITGGYAYWPLEITQDFISTARKSNKPAEEGRLIQEGITLAEEKLGAFSAVEQVPTAEQTELLAVRSTYAVLLARRARYHRSQPDLDRALQILESQEAVSPNPQRLADIREIKLNEEK